MEMLLWLLPLLHLLLLHLQMEMLLWLLRLLWLLLIGDRAIDPLGMSHLRLLLKLVTEPAQIVPEPVAKLHWRPKSEIYQTASVFGHPVFSFHSVSRNGL
jgi:hypothetical protein